MKKLFKILWAGWKSFAHALGVINTKLILSILYIFMVGFVSIVLFVLRKDLLERKRASKLSFWKTKEPQKLDINIYKHQF